MRTRNKSVFKGFSRIRPVPTTKISAARFCSGWLRSSAPRRMTRLERSGRTREQRLEARHLPQFVDEWFDVQLCIPTAAILAALFYARNRLFVATVCDVP